MLNNTYEMGKKRRKKITKHCPQEGRLYGPQGGHSQLGIPTLRDRIVQEVVRAILEMVYEPIFLDSSHGFRPGRSQHSALKQVRRNLKGHSWLIEGDISKCFDRIDREILGRLLSRRISDDKFISLIKKILKTRVEEEDGEINESIEGTLQGGECGPLLANIYLHELDQFMEDKKLAYDKGIKRRNPLDKEKHRQDGIQKARRIGASEIKDSSFRRLGYVRYANEFIVGIKGSKREASQLRTEIREFLEKNLKLELNIEKIKIANFATEEVKFLGYIIKQTPQIRQDRWANNGGKKGKVREQRSRQIYLKVDAKKVIRRLSEKGFCDKSGFPLPNFRYLHEPQSSVILKMKKILRGLERYYHLANNKRAIIASFYYIIRSSIAKMFAAKYKKRSMRAVFRLAWNTLAWRRRGKMPG